METFDTNVIVRLLVEDESLVLAALDAYARGIADFSDYLILETARCASALPVHTFDRRFAREPGVQQIGLEPVGWAPHAEPNDSGVPTDRRADEPTGTDVGQRCAFARPTYATYALRSNRPEMSPT